MERKKWRYIYKIMFETGHYYIGKRTCYVPIEQDTEYFGSPVTNASYWEKYSFDKIVLAEYDDATTLGEAEYEYIGDLYKTDPLCLNEHNTRNINNQSAEGKRWWTNGTKERLSFESPGKKWVLGRLHSTVLRVASSKKWNTPINKKWWHKDGEELFRLSCPGEGWVLGRPSISIRQKGKRKPATSESLRGKRKTEEHKKALSESKQKISHLYMGDNNVMKRDDVRENHKEITDSLEYRKKVSDGVRNSDRWTDEKRKEHANRMRARLIENSPSAKKVSIDGIEYKSIAAAMEATKMSRQKILKKYF